jgi:hypothetical protein
MLEDTDTEEFKKTMKRLQEDFQLELEYENERTEDADEAVEDVENEERK